MRKTDGGAIDACASKNTIFTILNIKVGNLKTNGAWIIQHSLHLCTVWTEKVANGRGLKSSIKDWETSLCLSCRVLSLERDACFWKSKPILFFPLIELKFAGKEKPSKVNVKDFQLKHWNYFQSVLHQPTFYNELKTNVDMGILLWPTI